jgi:hypothetical protein
MSLADWSRNGWLIAHKTSQNEIANLFAVIDRDLTDSNAKGLSVLGYERAGMVSDREADEMRKLAVALRAEVLN